MQPTMPLSSKAITNLIQLPQAHKPRVALVFILLLILKYGLIALAVSAPRLLALFPVIVLLGWAYAHCVPKPNPTPIRKWDGLSATVERKMRYTNTKTESGFASDILDGRYLLECLLEEYPGRDERVYRVRDIKTPYQIGLEAKEHTLVGVPKPLQESRRRNMRRNMKRLVKQGLFVDKIQHKEKVFLVYLSEPMELGASN
ncbi:hypothetical protein BJX61DRAFT_134780 [Aspergillus egyptiacus]|nr:hypothetical protein BJX61DRAFT_134780 [Aspergillus egyptiacus]